MISVIIIPTHVPINVVQVIVIMYDVNIRKTKNGEKTNYQ